MTVRRRRKCENCESRFTTYEKVQLQMPMVVKHDGRRRENYEREKIVKGLEKACLKRPVSTFQINDLIETVEKQVLEKFQSEISSDILGEMIMKSLHQIDEIAFVRFASFYWDFEGIKDFIEGLSVNINKFQNVSNQEIRQ